MNYQPKILYNPTDKQVEFMYDRQVYVFAPGERKLLTGEAADHAARFANCGLAEYDGTEVGPTSGMAYDKLPWTKLVKIASAKGIFKTGMGKEEICRLLEELEAKAENKEEENE